ncbi:helix-turn-helix protein [Haloactinospora alba]|uniref:Helix-turn-helix protein n=1 Tax=Haloactinospora alba TaxID=405555 RepID=A0A543NK98_9ACTN|nr:helix-turn-helix domain-containing protein [Haloactinospora alba]TQN32210.1 helix-turn-helix protein [Haloactinospora alba]
MANATANLLLHPVRLRILQTLGGADELTTAQLRERLPDIPHATMYRHVTTLTRAGILEVAAERPVRGTVERSYRIRPDAGLIDDDARTTMTEDDHRRAIAAFAGAFLADFERYLSRDDAEPSRENVLYRQGAVWVTDDEFAALVDDIEAAIARRTRSTPGDGRNRHLLSLAFVPDKSAKDTAESRGDDS